MKTHSTWFKQSALSIAIMSATVGVVTLPTPAFAQVETAALTGKITSDAQEGQEGVEITVRSPSRGFTKSTLSRADGSYVIIGLKPGTYEVTVGGLPSQEVTLLVGQTANMNFSVSGEMDGVERITVSGVRLESFSGGEVGTNITPEMMRNLPQSDRNFLAFADLAPGITVNRDANGTISLRGGAQHTSSVNVFLDGVSQKDYVLKGGVTGQDSSRGNPFPQSAIGEYKVITQNYKAEYEHVGSAAITAVTRSGTNEFEGDVFYDFTDEGLREAEPSEANGKTPSSTVQKGATLSGPIIKDTLHFLVSYENKEYETPTDVLGGSGVSAISLPSEYASQLGTFAGAFDEDLFFGKLDWTISDTQTLEGSYKYRSEDNYSFGGDRTVSNAGNAVVDEKRVNIKYTYYGDSFQNELRVTTEDIYWAQEPAVFEPAKRLQLSPDNNRQAILTVGGNAGYQTKGQRGWSVSNDFTWFDIEWHGYHVIKTGVKYKEVKLDILQQHNLNPQYYYDVEQLGEGTFNDTRPYRVQWFVEPTGTVGGQFVSENKQYGFYIQDDWEVNNRLTLNIGIRYDYEDNPTYTDYVTPADLVATLEGWDNIQNTDYNYRDYISTGNNRSNFSGAWAPRLGFSYGLDDDRLHTLFGGYGRSYDRNLFDLLKNETLRGTFATADYYFAGGHPENDCDPATQSNCVEWDPEYLTQSGLDSLIQNVQVKDEAHLLNNDLETPYSDQFSLGVRSVWGDWNTEASVSYVESKNEFSWYLGNRREDGSFFEEGTIFGPPWGFGLPDRGRHLIISKNDGETHTKSVFLKVARPHKDFWGMNVAYTFTDAEENRLVGSQFNLNYPGVGDYGWRKAQNIPEHKVVATASYDLPWDVKFSAKYTWTSEVAKEYVNNMNGNGQQFFDRVEPAESDYSRFDISLTKYIPVSYVMEGSEFYVRLDVQNLFNESNYSNFDLFHGPTADNFVQNENFAQPRPNSTTLGKRLLKLSAGFRF